MTEPALVGKVFSPIDPKLAAPASWPELDVDTLLYPPDEWFTDETADLAPAKLQILASGQVWGVVAPAGRCLLDGQPGCWSIPRPADGRGSALACPDTADYRMAHVGTTVLASGTEIPTATLAGAGGHHSMFHTPPDPAKSEYADTNRAVARGRYVWSDTAGGQVFIGALMPTIDEVKVAVARCSAVSVDYRWIHDEGRHVFFGSCLVNMGGLPSRYIRPVMAGAAVLVPDQILDQLDHKEAAMSATTTCTCKDQPKLAAYRLVDATGAPESGAEIALPDGRTGQFDEAVTDITGATVYLVRPVVDGKLAGYRERIAVPATEAAPTGKRFEWDDIADSFDAVLAAAVAETGAPADWLRRAKPGDVWSGNGVTVRIAAPLDETAPGVESGIDSKLDDIHGVLEEILAKVTDVHGATIDKAMADQGALPALPG